jgi:hypothetical protein
MLRSVEWDKIIHERRLANIRARIDNSPPKTVINHNNNIKSEKRSNNTIINGKLIRLKSDREVAVENDQLLHRLEKIKGYYENDSKELERNKLTHSNSIHSIVMNNATHTRLTKHNKVNQRIKQDNEILLQALHRIHTKPGAYNQSNLTAQYDKQRRVIRNQLVKQEMVKRQLGKERKHMIALLGGESSKKSVNYSKSLPNLQSNNHSFASPSTHGHRLSVNVDTVESNQLNTSLGGISPNSSVDAAELYLKCRISGHNILLRSVEKSSATPQHAWQLTAYENNPPTKVSQLIVLFTELRQFYSEYSYLLDPIHRETLLTSLAER